MKDLTSQESQGSQTVPGARIELLTHVSQLLEPLMMVLGILFMVLLLWMYAELPHELIRAEHLDEAMQLIWVIFVGDFVLRYVVAPDKATYLRRNWLIGLSLMIPFIRPLQAFRFLQAFHGFTLVAFLGAVNRTLRALRIITRGRAFLYMVIVTVGVILVGAVGVRYFDGDMPNSEVSSLSDAIWWSATLVTTLTHELDVESTEARLIAFGLRLYGLNVFCFFMASIASYLIGVDASYSRLKEEEEEVDPVQEEIRMLRAELRDIRQFLATGPVHQSFGSDAPSPTHVVSVDAGGESNRSPNQVSTSLSTSET